MSAFGTSWTKVPYDLRPAKQAERRMIVDALQRLSAVGFDIQRYQYTGMGSIFFYDYYLLHKLLGITSMWSVEINREIERRICFNRPYEFIELKMGPIGDYISELPIDRKHLLWLDYDSVIAREFIEDLSTAIAHLPIGSIVLITVDVEPPKPGDGPREWMAHYEAQVGNLLPYNYTPLNFAKDKLPMLNVNILSAAIFKAVSLRPDAKFAPIFDLLYRDGHKMLTLGGMLAEESDLAKIKISTLGEAIYYRADFTQNPFEIRLAPLTRKERIHLDAHMPCGDGWTPHDFEVDSDIVQNYRDIYRYLPAYGELLI